MSMSLSLVENESLVWHVNCSPTTRIFCGQHACLLQVILYMLSVYWPSNHVRAHANTPALSLTTVLVLAWVVNRLCEWLGFYRTLTLALSISRRSSFPYWHVCLLKSHAPEHSLLLLSIGAKKCTVTLYTFSRNTRFLPVWRGE